jgi:hypothetical protein
MGKEREQFEHDRDRFRLRETRLWQERDQAEQEHQLVCRIVRKWQPCVNN